MRVDTDKIRGKTFSMLSILSLAWTALLHTHVIPSLSGAIAPCRESFPLRKVRILSFECKALKCSNLALIDPQGGLPILGKNGWQTPRTQAKDRAPLRQLPISMYSINKASHWWEDRNDLYSTPTRIIYPSHSSTKPCAEYPFPLGDRTKAHSANPCLREGVKWHGSLRE